ncbi:restriction endonuclease subunit S [Staphylococcus chromogenes]|uniref:restriction endonuclease subunit S n=1 Tax=Staphylococcus chromogenes TaxID=46126 RepID=UPI002883E4B5|nr:restriction endonuclease subunit S [Staphylococcus chromogenes]MDT0740522.1 restriction endonuclease subunit S [Staphylococcus chromogenes]
MEYKVENLIDSVSKKHTFPGDKIIFLNTSDIEKGYVLHNNYSMIDSLPGQAKKSIQKGDILYSEIRPKNERFAYINFASDDYVVSTKLMVLRNKKPEILNTKYFYLYITSKKTIDYLQNLAESRSGTFPQITFSEVKNMVIDIPTLAVQNKIVNSIESIDKKIELNKKIIANLEELSQTLFKRWFVDFEFPDENGNPYKSSGGEMIDSELGMVPKGWKILELGKITEIIMGQSPKSDTYNTQNEGLPLLNGATDFKNRILNATKYTTDPKKRGQIGDYVFGVRATVGLVTELDRDYAIGRGAAVARVESTHKEWLYEILVKSFQYFENSISGSVYINISSNDLNNYKVIYPSTEIMYKYHDKLVSIFDLVKSVKLETNLLTLLRDTLLPKLMSGEIEMPEDIEVNEDELSI